jgi:hypothetical protein
MEWALSVQRVDLCKVSTYGFLPSSGKLIFGALSSPDAALRVVPHLQAKCTRTAVVHLAPENCLCVVWQRLITKKVPWDRTGWARGNALELCSGVAPFDSQP